jgi:hypothetical protein
LKSEYLGHGPHGFHEWRRGHDANPVAEVRTELVDGAEVQKRLMEVQGVMEVQALQGLMKVVEANMRAAEKE